MLSLTPKNSQTKWLSLQKNKKKPFVSNELLDVPEVFNSLPKILGYGVITAKRRDRTGQRALETR
jgi:hypothetical protein